MLVYLYSLQQIDSQLEEIEDLKGDLPRIVGELNDQVSDATKRLKELNTKIKQAKIDRDSTDVELLALAEKIEKYKTQQLQVKSNKQYDALTKEIDTAETRVVGLQEAMESSEGKIQIAKQDLEAVTAQLQEMTVELEEREKELKEVSKEHKKEETKFREERERMMTMLSKPDLDRYERIKRAKGSKAVVAVRRNACGGCFNRIPPQKILELRQNKHFFQCEHCGRILVSDDVVSKSAALV